MKPVISMSASVKISTGTLRPNPSWFQACSGSYFSFPCPMNFHAAVTTPAWQPVSSSFHTPGLR